MKNARISFEQETKELLKYIVLHGDLPSSDTLNMQVLQECCEMQYISGVYTAKMISGRVVAEVQQTVLVTKAGLDYLYPKRDIKFVISTVIAAVSVLVNLLQAFW